MLNEAHRTSGTQLEIDEWVHESKRANHEGLIYWFEVYQLEIIILLVVRIFREGNLLLLIASLKKALKFCFALDHVNYARWMSVFVRDLENLYVKNPETFCELQAHLSVKISGAKFSKISYDQKQEQNNKDIKQVSGYINLVNLEDKTFLRKIELASSEILKYIDEYEGKDELAKLHKEERQSFIFKYIHDTKNGHNIFNQNGN